MTIRFRPTEYVITAEGEWVAVDAVSFQHARPLLCGSCHILVSVNRNTSGRFALIHRPHSETDRRRMIRCRYNQSSISAVTCRL